MAFDIITPTLLARQEIPTVISTLRTVGTGKIDFIKNIDIVNSNASAVTVSLYIVPSGGSVIDAWRLIPDITIPAKSIWQWTGVQLAEAGATYRAIASTTGVAIHLSGGVAE